MTFRFPTRFPTRFSKFSSSRSTANTTPNISSTIRTPTNDTTTTTTTSSPTSAQLTRKHLATQLTIFVQRWSIITYYDRSFHWYLRYGSAVIPIGYELPRGMTRRLMDTIAEEWMKAGVVDMEELRRKGWEWKDWIGWVRDVVEGYLVDWLEWV